MTVNRAVDVRVLVIVRIVRRSGVFLIQHQPSRQQSNVRHRAYPCHVVAGATQLLVARCHPLTQTTIRLVGQWDRSVVDRRYHAVKGTDECV